MSFEENIRKSRMRKLVPPDKLDKHMRRARETDIDSRKEIFAFQSEQSEQHLKKAESIKPSIY